MAIVEAAARCRDTDYRSIEHFPGEAHRASKRPPQISRELAIAIVREPAIEAKRLLTHPRDLLCPPSWPSCSLFSSRSGHRPPLSRTQAKAQHRSKKKRRAQTSKPVHEPAGTFQKVS